MGVWELLERRSRLYEREQGFLERRSRVYERDKTFTSADEEFTSAESKKSYR